MNITSLPQNEYKNNKNGKRTKLGACNKLVFVCVCVCVFV